MFVCLLTNQDVDDPSISEYDWACDPRPYLPEADWHTVELGDKADSPREVRDLIKHGVDGRPIDVFFNLCDGGADQDDRPGIEVIRVLERANAAFTGAMATDTTAIALNSEIANLTKDLERLKNLQ